MMQNNFLKNLFSKENTYTLSKLGIVSSPVFQGSYASLLTCIIIFVWFLIGGMSLCGIWYVMLVFVINVIAIILSQTILNHRLFGFNRDPGKIIIDEVAGQLLTLYGLTSPDWEILVGLVTFRFFDVIKPYPIGISQKFPGGLGIIFDDFLAGIYALSLLNLLNVWLS